ncbi:recombinase family protein [Caulobacter sp. FWC2]|uniref:recombinase family protein n=1 Tax=Caulobacter sp. FWC2 TaxID=69664 RepID=UPI000C15E0E2|nr:recombinase family protein [Caulobacter sp. FWC2]PIB94724.1 DNA invertase [Caulobacter sp. FWC2]
MSNDIISSNAIVGYARTSSVEQIAGLEDQICELKAAGCTNIYSEQISSVDANRDRLREALLFLRSGDEFVFTKPDRLARNTSELVRIVDQLSNRGVRVRILSMNIDTQTSTGKLLLTMMGAVAEFEREVMLERQRVGIAKAKADGKFKGRPATARSKSGEIFKLSRAGFTASEIQKLAGVSRASYYRIAKEMPHSL